MHKNISLIIDEDEFADCSLDSRIFSYLLSYPTAELLPKQAEELVGIRVIPIKHRVEFPLKRLFLDKIAKQRY